MKISLAVAEDAEGNVIALYVGKDADKAKEAYTNAINGGVAGAVKAACFVRPVHLRRGDCVVTEKKTAKKAKE